MNRGDIWTVAGGVYASKSRPALIIQDDRFDSTDSVIVLPLTTTVVDAPLLRILLHATERSGIRQDSYLMIDKLTSVRRSSVQERVGRLTATQLVGVERAMLAFLGLAD
jgi:mRNA interferase MazF